MQHKNLDPIPLIQIHKRSTLLQYVVVCASLLAAFNAPTPEWGASDASLRAVAVTVTTTWLAVYFIPRQASLMIGRKLREHHELTKTD